MIPVSFLSVEGWRHLIMPATNLAWTPETMGDYCSGTNHVLPTYGHARAYSGLGVLDFVKRMTVQEVSPAGLADLGLTARTRARLESLDAHANAVTVRLEAIARETTR